MKIGLIGDTHDNVYAIQKAVKVFHSSGVELVIHVGDYCSAFTATSFKDLNTKLVGVFGENDGDRMELRKEYEKIGAEIHGEFHILEVEKKRIAITHGTDLKVIEGLANSDSFDLIVYGHTHVPKVTRINKTLLVNPGEACGFLYGKRTVAVVDLGKMLSSIKEF